MRYDVAKVLDYFGEDFFRLFVKVWNNNSEIMKKKMEINQSLLIHSEFIKNKKIPTISSKKRFWSYLAAKMA